MVQDGCDDLFTYKLSRKLSVFAEVHLSAV